MTAVSRTDGPASVAGDPLGLAPAARSERAVRIKVLLRTPAALVGIALIGGIVATALLGPLILRSQPDTMQLTDRLLPPSSSHLLGTDAFGRDIFTRIVYGARMSILIGVVAVGLGAVLGTTIGSAAGFFGGRTDLILMRAMDALVSFPAVLLAIAIIAILGTGLLNLMVAIGIATVPVFARVMRGEVLRVRELDFVTSARSMGASPLGILWRHVVPNAMAVVIVIATLQIAAAILAASSLSFLGLGIQPPTAEWGSMLAEGRRFINTAPWMLIAPGGAIVLTVLGFNLLGDALRDVLDPTLDRRR